MLIKAMDVALVTKALPIFYNKNLWMACITSYESEEVTVEKIAFVFPGQGSQYVKMGKGLYDNYKLAKDTFEEANDVLGYDIGKICFEGNLSKLNALENLFPAILAVSVATARVFMQDVGLRPQFCAGHSLGEYSALVCAGAISFADAIKITHKRGLLAKTMDTNRYGMTILDNTNIENVEALCNKLRLEGKQAWISCYNSKRQVAISGEKDAMRIVEDYVLEEGGQISPLWECPPMHCPIMKIISDQFREELERYEYHSLRYTVISNTKALPYDRDLPIANTLLEQLTKPVQWNGIMRYFQKFGISSVIEMGPKIVLSSFAEETNGSMKGFCYGQKKVREILPEMLWKGNNQSEVMPTLVTKCLAVSASTPNNNFDEQEYERGVIENHSVIKKIFEQNRKDGQNPTLEQSKKAILCLKEILETKKVPLDEQNEWINQILDETGMLYELKNFVTDQKILV